MDDVREGAGGAAGESAPGGGGVGWWPAFLAAVGFLTRLPVRSPAVATRSALARAPVYFPLVGIGVGVFTAGTVALGLLIWPAWLAVLVALALEARLTGALHEDGLADFCDGFGGGWTRDEVLAIFEDSRIGTYGALGLFMAVALRAAALTALVMPRGFDDALAWGSAIAASAALGRWAMVLALVCLAPVEGRASLSREVGADLRIRNLAIGSLWMLPAVTAFAVFIPWHALAALVAVLMTCALFLLGVRRKLGGVTGDCLGCLCYVVQIVVLLVAAAQVGERGILSSFPGSAWERTATEALPRFLGETGPRAESALAWWHPAQWESRPVWGCADIDGPQPRASLCCALGYRISPLRGFLMTGKRNKNCADERTARTKVDQWQTSY